MIKNLTLISIILMLFPSFSAEARHHHKFKGIIVVNQIMKLEGTITNNGVQAMEYSGVKPGDVLETGDKSFAVVRIPGLAIFRMGANTRFRLTSFSDRNESRFEVQKGEVLNVFRRPGHHIVQLNHSTLTLHGTTFFVETDPLLPVDLVCLCDGKVSAKVKETDSKTVTSSPTVVNETKSPTISAMANASPVGSPYTGAVISAEPVASPAAEALVVKPSPTPPPLLKEMEVSSQQEHKQFALSSEGIELKDLKLLDHHSVKEIQELDSLYDLP